MSFFEELKRRKVFKVGVGYLVVAWLVVQVASIGFPTFEAPPWALRVFILVVLLGFPISLLFAWAFDVTPEGVKAEPATLGTKRLVATAAVLAALSLAWYFRGQPSTPPESELLSAATSSPVASDSRSQDEAAKVEPLSIAVLPFVDMSQGQDQEYFSDGLSEELLNLLAQLPQLKVIARTSSFSFKGKDVDVATIARQLKVAHLLEGSVRKSGNTLRVTAQLIRTSDSTHLWSQTYDRELTDVFKVQDEIASAVVEALKVELLPEQAMNNAHRSDNAQAYNEFLRGNATFNRGNEEGWRQAIAAYQRAIALEPGYAAAHARLAFAQANLADRLGDPAAKDLALAYADRAIALGPDLSDGYVTRGISRLAFRGDWAGARADFDRALALNPGNAEVQIGHSRLLGAQGRAQEAIVASRRATELDPLDPESRAQLGRLLNAVGQFPAARQALDRSLQLNPESDHARFHRGMNDLLQGDAQAALARFQAMGAESGYALAGIAMAEYSLGHAAESQRALDAEIARFAQGAAYQIAETYAWRGEKDKAFEWLERAHVQQDGGLSFIKVDPLLSSIESDPRFAALLKKLGLPK